MKQVFLSGRGQVDVFDVPLPGRMSGCVLVQNAFSLISAGTEGAAVTKSDGIKGLYEKVLTSLDRTDQVWNMVQAQGVKSTLELIKGKLDDYTPIGYSCTGVVLETDGDDLGFKPGQRVACMGTGFANHADYVVVPKSLVVPIPETVSFENAAFAAIACIAMQGIRRLELTPGERIAIIGLGLIGQIAIRLATVMGYQVFGFDIDSMRVLHAKKYNDPNFVFNSSECDPVAVIKELTSGSGVDGVAICASSKTDSLINQAFNLCRKRGRVSVVGDIGLGLERAKMYAKELEVRLSCSYGVGRYDPEYELLGRDYPLPYVRWTERRNLEYFITLLGEGHLNLSDLVSAQIAVEDARKAYALIKSGDIDIYGVLLDYHLPSQPELNTEPLTCVYEESCNYTEKSIVQVGLIGVGSYAKNIHVPNIRKLDNMKIRAVASNSGASAAVVAKKVKAAYATSATTELLADQEVDAVVISTRHSSHAELAVAALESGKHVFVEKPMAITIQDCMRIVEAQQASKCIVRVGFNRRFSPFLKAMRYGVGQGRRLFNIRVNVGPMSEHWSNTVEEGGRLMGEGVHFFDLANWMIGSTPIDVTAQFLGEVDMLNPDASVSIRYEDGSVANIIYTTVGHTKRGKEYFELFGNGRTVVIDDYKNIKGFGCNIEKSRQGRGDKGQFGAIEEFALSVKSGSNAGGADAVAGLLATAITVAALRSAETKRCIALSSLLGQQ